MTDPEVERLLDILGHCPKGKDVDIDCRRCFTNIGCENQECCDTLQLTTTDQLLRLLYIIKDQPEIVRCKDCRHRPLDNGESLDFPDSVCPCQNDDDYWYSYNPDDDWYCPKGERKDVKNDS